MQANLNENLINGVYGSGLSAYFFAEGNVGSSSYPDTGCEPGVNDPCGPFPVPDPPDNP